MRLVGVLLGVWTFVAVVAAGACTTERTFVNLGGGGTTSASSGTNAGHGGGTPSCKGDPDCTEPDAPFCDTATGTCVACVDGAGCSGSPATPFCDPVGKTCVECLENSVCPPGAPICAPATHACATACSDGVVDPGETDVDCGGTSCPRCAVGNACLVAADCASGFCPAGSCKTWATMLSVGPASSEGTLGCILTPAGGVKCWGYNLYGQLGINSTANSLVPVDVVADVAGTPLTGISAVAAGGYHGCALTNGGGVKCWGFGAQGQLGNGANNQSLVPVDVVDSSGNPVTGIKFVSGGGSHNCIVTTAGAPKCFGYNVYGQLGDGSITNSSTPVAIQGVTSGVAVVRAGVSHTCAVTTAGGVTCWGRNLYGQLGNNSTVDAHGPVGVSGLTSGVKDVAVGEGHTCALTTTGAVKCWGYGGDGELGDGLGTTSLVPIDVPGLSSGVKAIAAGEWHTCAVTSTGAVECWGYNVAGQLGIGTAAAGLLPAQATGLDSGAEDVAAGFYTSCAMMKDGRVLCWGFNTNGELGDLSTTPSQVPVDVIEN